MKFFFQSIARGEWKAGFKEREEEMSVHEI